MRAAYQLRLSALVLVLSGCPGGATPPPPSAPSAPPAEANDSDAGEQEDSPELPVCFECEDPFPGAGSRLDRQGRPLCGDECKQSLAEREQLATEAGEIICRRCGSNAPKADVAYLGPKRFCGKACRDTFKDEQPKPTCRECGDEVPSDSTYIIGTDTGLTAGMKFCGQDCVDAWVEGMNSR
jgi:hypothetical protein